MSICYLKANTRATKTQAQLPSKHQISATPTNHPYAAGPKLLAAMLSIYCELFVYGMLIALLTSCIYIDLPDSEPAPTNQRKESTALKNLAELANIGTFSLKVYVWWMAPTRRDGREERKRSNVEEKNESDDDVEQEAK